MHGTTGSSDNTFILASKLCNKINIAGTFLRVLLENLDPMQKELIGFKLFDAKSKYLCAKINLIKEIPSIESKMKLKKVFSHYCILNSVKGVPEKKEEIIRKPYFGRNEIAKYIFSRIEEKLKI